MSISDHLIQFVFLTNLKKVFKIQKQENLKRDFSVYNEDEFSKDLQTIDWNDILKIYDADTNKSFDTFYGLLDKLVDEHAPLKKLTKKQISLKSKPWVNKEIKFLMIKRDKTFKTFCKEQNPVAKDQWRNEFKKQRNDIKSRLAESKKFYYEQFFQNNISNITKTWQGIETLVSIKYKNKAITTSLIHNKSIVNDPREICNIFNDFFIDIGPSLASKIKSSKKHYSNFLKNSLSESMFINATDEREIENIINSLNKKKALGPNSIPIKILKDHAVILSKPLSLLINLSFETGVFPDLCKIARVTPI